MAFGPPLTTTLRRRLALSDVPKAVTLAPSPERRTGSRGCSCDSRASKQAKLPQRGGRGLNLHAGESGLGREDLAIMPGMGARPAPHATDSSRRLSPCPRNAFRLAVRDFDGVVAMYHDQATIPMKRCPEAAQRVPAAHRGRAWTMARRTTAPSASTPTRAEWSGVQLARALASSR
jgi:4-hydroxythreonine-4-phosphate dehydrogenase